MNDVIKGMNILIVDDTADNLEFLKQLFTRRGFDNITIIQDSRQVMDQIEKEEPDIILLDLMMPHVDGFTILNMISDTLDESVFLPILVLTADTNRQSRQLALNKGAIDFLTKPLDALEVLQRVKNHLNTRYMYKQQLHYSTLLESSVEEQSEELHESYQMLHETNVALDDGDTEIVERLAEMIESKEDDSGKHTVRVGELSSLVSANLGFATEFTKLIKKAARLHDIGKIGVPESVLLKTSMLTDDEFSVMEKHSVIGAKILSGSKSSLLQMAENIALSHHEHWNGQGYPQGLSGQDIPIEARIVAVVDVYDALTHNRSYRNAWSQEKAIELIEKEKGEQFDPTVVEAFLTILKSTDLEVLDEVLDADSASISI